MSFFGLFLFLESALIRVNPRPIPKVSGHYIFFTFLTMVKTPLNSRHVVNKINHPGTFEFVGGGGF